VLADGARHRRCPIPAGPRLTGNPTVAYFLVVSDDALVFAALADTTRRHLLDRLHACNGQTLVELCASLDMTRQAVSKHLKVLERAGLVVVLRRGREKHHYLNPAPVADIAVRWLGKFERARVTALAELKRQLEEQTCDDL
jgi:DNA-binding transcriptional ArsR family regulator